MSVSARKWFYDSPGFHSFPVTSSIVRATDAVMALTAKGLCVNEGCTNQTGEYVTCDQCREEGQ